jgi:hypothetical protein
MFGIRDGPRNKNSLVYSGNGGLFFDFYDLREGEYNNSFIAQSNRRVEQRLLGLLACQNELLIAAEKYSAHTINNRLIYYLLSSRELK